MKTKYLVDIMVFGMVISNDDIIPPFIFPHGLRFKVCNKYLKEVVLT